MMELISTLKEINYQAPKFTEQQAAVKDKAFFFVAPKLQNKLADCARNAIVDSRQLQEKLEDPSVPKVLCKLVI